MTAVSLPSQFKSKFRSFQAIVRHGYPIIHPVTGTKTGEVKALVADFAVHRGEFKVFDPNTGAESTHADIVGFFFDLDEAAARNKWDADEKEAVRTRLLALCEEWPEAVQVHEAKRATVPWPTYAKVPAENIALLAADLGLVSEALAYEKENDNRPEVVAALEKAVSIGAESSEELTAV